MQTTQITQPTQIQSAQTQSAHVQVSGCPVVQQTEMPFLTDIFMYALPMICINIILIIILLVIIVQQSAESKSEYIPQLVMTWLIFFTVGSFLFYSKYKMSDTQAQSAYDTSYKIILSSSLPAYAVLFMYYTNKLI